MMHGFDSPAEANCLTILMFYHVSSIDFEALTPLLRNALKARARDNTVEVRHLSPPHYCTVSRVRAGALDWHAITSLLLRPTDALRDSNLSGQEAGVKTRIALGPCVH